MMRGAPIFDCDFFFCRILWEEKLLKLNLYRRIIFLLNLLGVTIIWCLLALLSASVYAQRDSKWSWSANNRNNIDGHDRHVDRRKYESLEDLR